MDIVRKDAVGTVSPGADDGSFEIILSTGTKDRDGEEVLPDEWEQPLPAHITMDADHGMTAEKTVGSGTPSIENGKMIVRGTYAKTALGQDIRSLVNDGHIRTTSVAFLRKTSVDQKSGSKVTTRELLNGAFVAIPANPEALVLSSKSGARNNKTDAQNIQAIHDQANALGASCPDQADGKALVARKAGTDPTALISAIDASLDEACNQLGTVDLELLPFPVQQALALVTSAGTNVDKLMEILGITDPDKAPPADDTDSTDTDQSADGQTESDDNEDNTPRPAASAAPQKAAVAATAEVDESDLASQLSHIKIMASIYGRDE